MSNIDENIPNDPQPIYGKGLINTYYEGTWSSLSHFLKLDPSTRQQPNPSIIDHVSIDRYRGRDNSGVVQEGYLSLNELGIYTFKLWSGNGSRLYIDNILLINNNGKHPPQDQYDKISLKSGYHFRKVTYFKAEGGELLYLQYSIKGRPFQNLDQNKLCHRNIGNELPTEPCFPEDPDDSPDECPANWNHANSGTIQLQVDL